MHSRDIDHVRVELVIGDIADQTAVDAVVNAANAQLMPGGGVAGALHRAAGPGLAEECRPLAPIAPGECVLTGGHELPNPYVLHCLGPVYGVDGPADALLAACYREALRLADRERLHSVAFPAISTGAFGYPMEQAAAVALNAIADACRPWRRCAQSASCSSTRRHWKPTAPRLRRSGVPQLRGLDERTGVATLCRNPTLTLG